MLWGSLFILKAVVDHLHHHAAGRFYELLAAVENVHILIANLPCQGCNSCSCLLWEAEPTGIQQGKAAFMERSAEPNFHVWAYVVSCPFLDLNVYPWRPTGGEIFPDAKVMRAWTDKYRVAMAAQKIRQLSFFFLVPHKKEVFQIFSLPLLAPVFTSSRILFAS